VELFYEYLTKVSLTKDSFTSLGILDRPTDCLKCKWHANINNCY